MNNFLLVFGLILPVPVTIYVLSATKLISQRSADVALGVACIVFGIGFLAFCMFIFLDSGQTINPSKFGPSTVLPGRHLFRHIMAAIFCLFLSGGVIYVGWTMLKPKVGAG